MSQETVERGTTCNPMGAGKWRSSYCRDLAGRTVYVLPDNDDVGRTHAASVAASLAGIASSVRVVELPGLPPKGDVSDFLNAGKTAEELVSLCAGAPSWRPAHEATGTVFSPSVTVTGLENVVDPLTWQGDPPERRWLVRDWVPWGRVTALYGDGGTGKTLLAQMLVTAAATGNDWLGIETEPCKALMIACEDDADELWRRQAAINAAYGVDMADLERVLYWPRATEDNLLVTFDPSGEPIVHDLYYAITAKAKAFGAQLVVIDTAADVFGGNENIRAQVNFFLKAVLGRLAQEIDGSVILCAHPSVSGKSGDGYSGSTAWNNAVRSRLYLTRPKRNDEEEEDRDERVLERSKSNYARSGDSIRLRWQDGAFALLQHEYGDLIDRIDANGAFMTGLAKATSQGRDLSDSKNATSYAPKIILGMPHTKAFTLRDMERAMQTLFDAGRIRVENYGKGARSRHIVAVSSVL